MSEELPQPVTPRVSVIEREPLPPDPMDRLAVWRRRSLWLFLATVASTFFAGTVFVAGDEPSIPARLLIGAAYCGTIMAILIAHELGHYLQAIRYGVPATPPLFIPMPISPVGTMGAVIVQAPGYTDRRILFDIAVSGPLAGLVLAIPAVAWSAQFLTPVAIIPGSTLFGDPLLVKGIVRYFHGALPPGTDIQFRGVAGAVFFAGWFGILMTGLNLLPLGQLDGGHILYSLVGRRQHAIARALYYAAWGVALFTFAFGRGTGLGWLPMLVIISLIGIYHPPTRDDFVPLGPVRYVIGWFTLALLIVCFVPVPITEVPKTDTPAATAPAAKP